MPGPVVLPSGTRHLISPVLRSYAVMCDHGGPIAAMPFAGLRRKSYGTDVAHRAFRGRGFRVRERCCGLLRASRPGPFTLRAVGSSSLRSTRSITGKFFDTT